MLHLIQPGQRFCLHCCAQSLQPPRSLNDLDQIPTHHLNIPDVPTVLASRARGQIPLPSLQGRQHPGQSFRRRRRAARELTPSVAVSHGPRALVRELLAQLLVLHPPGLGLQPRGIQFRLERSDAGSIIRGPTGLVEQPACTHTDKLPARTDRWPNTRAISTTRRHHVSITVGRDIVHPPPIGARPAFGYSSRPCRSRCGTTTYFGSRAEAWPASKIPMRVSRDPARNDAPETAAPTRLLPAAKTAPATPATFSALAAPRYLPARPVCMGSAVMPMERSISWSAAASSAAPPTASRRAGPVWSVGATSRPSPPAAAAADPAKTNGNSRCASCHEGVAVSASRTAV